MAFSDFLKGMRLPPPKTNLAINLREVVFRRIHFQFYKLK